MMTETITSFLEAKKNISALENAARKELQAEYSAALVDAAQIQKTYKENFGSLPELPSAVKTFTINADVKIGKRVKKNPDVTEINQNESTPTLSGKKIAGLQRRLNTLGDKLAAAKAQGKSTQKFVDEIYQIKDELRLAGVPGYETPDNPSESVPAETLVEAPPVSLQSPVLAAPDIAAPFI